MDKARRYRRELAGSLFALGLGFFAVILFIVIEYAGTFSINAIVGTTTTLLTVEGFLLGLSSLIRGEKARAFPVSLGILAMMSSLLTIEAAQTISSLQTLYPEQMYTVRTPFLFSVSIFQYYTLTVFLFIMMLEVYWGSALGRKRRTEGEENWSE